MKTNFTFGVRKSYVLAILMLLGFLSHAQTLPYQITNNSGYSNSQIYVAIVGITDGHVWVDPVTGQVNPMSTSNNTVQGPVISGNQGPGENGRYANCFRKLSDIPNQTLNIPQIAGCRIMISFESQLYLYFFGHSGAPSGYSAPNLANPTDPNQGIKFEMVELTYNQYGLWCNTTRVDTYQYPMGLEVWGNGFYKKVGELKTHSQIMSDWQASAPTEFQGLLNTSEGIIHFPTKSASFPQSLIQGYINQIWSKYSSQQLVFNAGDAGTWRGSVSGNNFVFTRDSDGQVATIPGKPTTVMAMEASGVMASGAQWDLVVQAQIAAAINRHAINLNLGSGVMQNFGNSATYYQTWPYNWYAKFWHRSDISVDSKTYAFSFDDVFDQSATVHTPSPTNIKITIGGFAGQNNNTGGVATVYQNCNAGGSAFSLPVGDYTMAALASRGIPNDYISSINVNAGYELVAYWDDNYTGSSITITGSNACLVDEGWNDKITSLKVRAISGSSTLIEAESWAVESGTQKEACSEGGENVGYIDNNDWMVWDVNIPTNGSYKVEYRIASPNSNGVIQLENAGGSPVYGTVNVTNTGGWQNWNTVSHNVNLSSGQQQIAIKAATGGWNLNWIKITKNGGARIAEIGDELKEELTLEYKLYPNPTDDLLHIEGITQSSDYAIYDMTGRPILKGQLAMEQNVVDVQALKSGYYFLLLLDSGKTLRFNRK